MGFDGCRPGANPWIELHFHDCIYTAKDGVSFALGLASIVAWVIAQVPQFISNIKNQSAEALSVWFLAQWFLGDTLNLLGCLIQGQQLPTTTALAMYFVLSDVIMLMQFIYFTALGKRRERLRQLAQKNKRHRHHHHHRHRQQAKLEQGAQPEAGHQGLQAPHTGADQIGQQPQGENGHRRLRQQQQQPGHQEEQHDDVAPSAACCGVDCQLCAAAQEADFECMDDHLLEGEPQQPGQGGREEEEEDHFHHFVTLLEEHQQQQQQQQRQQQQQQRQQPQQSSACVQSQPHPYLCSFQAAPLQPTGRGGQASASTPLLAAALAPPTGPGSREADQSTGRAQFALWRLPDQNLPLAGCCAPRTPLTALILLTTSLLTLITVAAAISYSSASTLGLVADSSAIHPRMYSYSQQDTPTSLSSTVALPLPLRSFLPGCEPSDDDDYSKGGSAHSPWWCDTNALQLLAGTTLGYLSTCMYLSSRASQIYKNSKRGSAEGLSLAMFCLSVTANLCTGTSIVLRLAALDALKAQLPWICGTFGTVGLDLTIAYQTISFQRKASALNAPLLDNSC